ncbi:hypothetical protein BV898_01119 [Hypsibius exemplaris]|uniref:Uncharacterized protein n=1 Tax=Hypsibius exemplaris TaxID=2072580 RepID=A0A1W0XBL0_HYPEX|nr:hypothetical protein BV898_01119 [Hypsibius exemplaris]
MVVVNAQTPLFVHGKKSFTVTEEDLSTTPRMSGRCIMTTDALSMEKMKNSTGMAEKLLWLGTWISTDLAVAVKILSRCRKNLDLFLKKILTEDESWM